MHTLAEPIRDDRGAQEWTAIEHLSRPPGNIAMVGDSAPMQAVYRMIERFAPHRINVLILGESGSGKELVSHALHRLGPFAAGPFISFNCASLIQGLAESQLVGHVRGAFTDARESSPGCFQQANGGTLLLDDIAEVPLGMQAKLLRLAETLQVQPLGAHEPHRLDLRLVATTTRDLRKMVAAGEFRDDLFYRLEAASIPIPPLRERIEDVPALTAYFISYYNEAYGKQIHSVSRRALALLESHGWPGNVRELAHALERATLLSDDDRIDICDLPPDLLVRMKEEELELSATQSAGSATRDRSPAAGMGGGDGTPLGEALKAAVERSLSQAHGDSAAAAKLLGISRSSLYRKIARFGIKRRRRPVPTTNRLKSAG